MEITRSNFLVELEVWLCFFFFEATGRSSTFLLRRRKYDQFIKKTGRKLIQRYVKRHT
jgi:hypothetical protein